MLEVSESAVLRLAKELELREEKGVKTKLNGKMPNWTQECLVTNDGTPTTMVYQVDKICLYSLRKVKNDPKGGKYVISKKIKRVLLS